MLVAFVAFGVLVLLLILKVPIAFATGIAALAGILSTGVLPVMVLPQRMFFGVDSFVLIAVPLFILTGKLMEVGGITRDLLNLAKVMVGFLRGGLAYVNIVASMIFAGITGSASADTASVGSILIPAMIKSGYKKDFTVAVTASSSTIGVMIPPSIAMVVYGVASSQSIGRLFLGGIIPGILVGFSLMGVSYYYARKENYPIEERISVNEALVIIVKSIPALLSVVLVIGGIISGVFTPTEAAGVGVLYSFLLGVFYYKELKIRKIPAIIYDVSLTVGMAMLLVATASALGWLCASQQIPQLLSDSLLSITDNKLVILLLINLLLLFVGTWLETTAAIIIFTPILLPVITAIGVDPVHFGVIMVVNLAIGLFTPPVGVCLFIACGIAGISISESLKALFPFFIATLLVLLLITYVPELVTFLPDLLWGKSG